MQHTLIEVNKLETSPLNTRRTAAKAALEEMKASILAHGLMQNLVVTASGEGGFRVIAGSRRLAALRALQAEGKLPEDYAAPCQVASYDHATEMSLAENTVRLAMHPADEFEAFARLIEGGNTVEQIARRFGVTVRHVEQRLRLGRIAPELLSAYRAEELTLECLTAFAITDDREKQLRVYESLPDWRKSNPGSIRQALTESLIEADDKLARFVGLDAYHAAGGASRADLFGDQVYLENPELLQQLAADKLDGVRRELEAEGWKWVEVSPDRDWNAFQGCGRIHPQPVDAPPELLDLKTQAETELEGIHRSLEDTESDALLDALEEAEEKLAGIEEKLESFVAYDPEEMRSAGCCVSIGHDGEISVERGLVTREDMKRLADDGDGPTPRPKGMPESLRRDLESYRLQAAQVEIARHRLVALDLLAFTAACSVLAGRPSTGPDVQFRGQYGTHAVQKEQTAAGEALKAIREGLPLAWLHQETEAEQFQAFLGLSDKDKLDLLAWCVATSLKPQLSTGKEATACELALSLTDASMAAYWRPTRSNYLGRITRDQLLALGRELLGEQWSQARSRDKKGELADALERAFADPQKVACTPAQREKLTRWLPEGMAFDGGDAGTLAAGAEDRKAA
jgi:ParB family chromosome partitioning protein